MLDDAAAKQIVHAGEPSQATRVLVCLAVGDAPKTVAQIREIGARIGIHKITKWNLSDILGKSNGTIRTPSGWELTQAGRKEVETLAGPLASAPLKAATSLRAQLAKIKSPDAQSFVEQAVSCFEHELYRAAVVLSWVGAVALLYDHIVANHLAAFNAEALKRDSKWKAAKTADDLGLMKEHDFLQVLHSISVIGKNLKQELEARLKLRNACGHPNSFQIAEYTVASHIEILILNVFAKF